MQLREAIKNQGYGANRRIAKVLGYDENHLFLVASGQRAPSVHMMNCLKVMFPEGVSFDDVIKPKRVPVNRRKQ